MYFLVVYTACVFLRTVRFMSYRVAGDKTWVQFKSKQLHQWALACFTAEAGCASLQCADCERKKLPCPNC